MMVTILVRYDHELWALRQNVGTWWKGQGELNVPTSLPTLSPKARLHGRRGEVMTYQQWEQAKPIRASAAYHASQGCDIRHKTNKALNHCEDKMERGTACLATGN